VLRPSREGGRRGLSQAREEVCEACAVEVSGELYCKACIREEVIEKEVEEKRVARPERATVITVASVLFYVLGALGIVGSMLVILFGALLSSLPSLLPTIPSQLRAFILFPAWLFIAFGLAALILSALDVVAGYWLWLSLKKGGILGIALCVASMALSIPFASLDVVSTSIDIVIDIALIVLIAVGWNTLK